jgi:hypothetical protein
MTTSDPLGQDLAQGQVDERDVEAVADASGGELDDRRHADADRRGHLPPQALHDRDDVVEERAPDPLAGARDDRSGDGEQQQVAAARALVDGEEARGGHDAADGGHRGAEREDDHTHAPDLDAGASRRFGVAADGADVPAEAHAIESRSRRRRRTRGTTRRRSKP